MAGRAVDPPALPFTRHCFSLYKNTRAYASYEADTGQMTTTTHITPRGSEPGTGVPNSITTSHGALVRYSTRLRLQPQRNVQLPKESCSASEVFAGASHYKPVARGQVNAVRFFHADFNNDVFYFDNKLPAKGEAVSRLAWLKARGRGEPKRAQLPGWCTGIRHLAVRIGHTSHIDRYYAPAQPQHPRRAGLLHHLWDGIEALQQLSNVFVVIANAWDGSCAYGNVANWTDPDGTPFTPTPERFVRFDEFGNQHRAASRHVVEAGGRPVQCGCRVMTSHLEIGWLRYWWFGGGYSGDPRTILSAQKWTEVGQPPLHSMSAAAFAAVPFAFKHAALVSAWPVLRSLDRPYRECLESELKDTLCERFGLPIGSELLEVKLVVDHLSP